MRVLTDVLFLNIQVILFIDYRIGIIYIFALCIFQALSLNKYDDEPLLKSCGVSKSNNFTVYGVANPTVDLLNKLKNGIDVQDFDNTKSVSLSSGDLIAQAKKFEGPLSVKANVVVEALEGKSTLAPKQLVWCGMDNVLLYWDYMLLMVGPCGDPVFYLYDEPVILIPECDGARILSNSNIEFLQRVPASTESIFKIGSTEPTTLLYDALDHFDRRNAKVGQKSKPEAVEVCVDAARHEFDPSLQQTLPRVASYGQAFCRYLKNSEENLNLQITDEIWENLDSRMDDRRISLFSACGRLVISSDGVWDALSTESALECSRGLALESATAQIVKVRKQKKS
uniref:Vps16 N-terminal domain-containing protein n=1 Tax=Lactuca sativa TaxID=4236 RepID=A0A9R1UZS6_LACSA|nr:hypothetical protein LSAT_V11C700348050 [Lactuca sativa]